MSAKRKLSIGCGLVVLFGMGVLTGLVAALFLVTGLAHRVESWNTEESRRFITNHFANVLDLSEEQKQLLAPMIGEALEERWEMRQKYREETDRVFREKYAPRLEEILSEEQQAKLQKRWAKWREEKRLDAETGESVGAE